MAIAADRVRVLRGRPAHERAVRTPGRCAIVPGDAPEGPLDDRIARGVLVAASSRLLIFLLAPMVTILVKSVEDKAASFVGLANFETYFQTPASARSIWNSDLGRRRSVDGDHDAARLHLRLRAHTQLHALQGHVQATSRWCRCWRPRCWPRSRSSTGSATRACSSRCDGSGCRSTARPGIVLSMVFATFPHALMILVTALSLTDARLYEAADCAGHRPCAQVLDDHAARRASTA